MSVKKILALLLAAMMVFGMTSAMAADPTFAQTEIPITKTLYFYNEDNVDVYEPAITYTYTVSAGQGGASITDNAGHTGIATAGRELAFGADAAARTISIVFDPSHAKVEADTNGTAVTKKNVFTFNPEALKYDGENGKWYGEDGYDAAKASYRAGIYRYIITENTTETNVNTVGIKRDANYDSTLVLDIFVTNDGDIVPKIVEPGTGNNDNPDIDNKDKTDENQKTTGFGDPEDDPTNPDTPENPTDPDDKQTTKTVAGDFETRPVPSDTYKTYNLTINKQVEGGMGDKAHKFPFASTIANSISTAKFTVKVADAAATTQLVSAGIPNGSIKHGESIVITGLPSVVADTLSVAVTETNDTTDEYKVKAIFNENTTSPAFSENNVAAGANAVASAVTLTGESSSVKNELVFTNTLEEISPTGVVLRFAPYFAMFAAGCVLFLILATKRSKKEEE